MRTQRHDMRFRLAASDCGRVGIAMLVLNTSLLGADQTLMPVADGTIVDGGQFGPMDGIPDDADWYFNLSNYQGAIALVFGGSQSLDRRVVWEFDLGAILAEPPVTAKLSFTIRGNPVFPADTAVVQVVSYAADLLELPSDFGAGPATLATSEAVAPFQPPTTCTVDVSTTVNAFLATGEPGVGFRFQIDTESQSEGSEAFIDARDADPGTKPKLTITDRVPGDVDGDRDVDLADFAEIADCLSGPGTNVYAPCTPADFDVDRDVDLLDVQTFFTSQPQYGE